MNPFADGINNASTFIVKNNSTKKSITLFGISLKPGNSYNLMNLEGVTENDIKVSLLKGVLKRKINTGELSITSTDIDLTTLNSTQLSFLQSNGVNYGVLPGGGLYKTIYPKNNGTDDWANLNTEMSAAAYKYALYLSPVDKNGVAASFRCEVASSIPAGTVIIGNPGTSIISYMTPIGSQLNTVFYSAPVFGAQTTTSAQNTPGTKTISTVASVPAGSLIRIRDDVDHIQIDYYTVISVAGVGPYTLTLDRVVRRTFASGSLVQVVISRPENIHIYGNGMKISGTGDRAIEMIGSYKCLVDSVHIVATNGSFSDAGMSWDTGGRESVFRNCSIDGGNITGYGLLLETNDHCSMENCWAINCTNAGILMTDCYDSVLNHCQSYNNKTVTGNGFYIGMDGANTVGCVDCSIFECSSWDNGLDGFQIGYCQNLKLTNSTAYYNDRHGFNIGAGQGTTFTTLTSCSAQNNAFNGYNIDATSTKTKLSLCVSKSNGNVAFLTESESNLIDCVSNLDTTSAMYASSGSHNVIATDCYFEGPSSGAQNIIDIRTTGTVRLTRTKVLSSVAGSICIRQQTASTVVLEDCDIVSAIAGSYGIYQISASSTLILRGRNALDSSTAGPLTIAGNVIQECSGQFSLAIGDANKTLTYSQSSYEVILATGAQTAKRDIIIPAIPGVIHTIQNNTTGGFAVRVIAPTGTGIDINAGTNKTVIFDGTNVIQIS